jgi:hypothetical protein
LHREHATILYLNPAMRLGTIKVASFYEIGQTYASLLIYNEGLHEMGQISEQEYQLNKIKYSKKLVEAPVNPLSREQLKEKERLESMQRTFQAVLIDWENNGRPQSWRDQWIRQAEKYKDQIPEAKQLLDKVASKVFVP